MISREVSVYKDLYGNIIDCWDNSVLKPETPQDVPVVHVWNDPVNFTISGGNGVKVGEQVVWTTEVFLNYPSPLPVESISGIFCGNTYQSSEIFKFFSQWEDLNDPTQNSVPVTLTWSRVGQYLPWMQMGQQPGKLVYHTHGFKVMDGFDGLPQALKDFVLERDPKFQFAPDTDVSPNETSWKVFKKFGVGRVRPRLFFPLESRVGTGRKPLWRRALRTRSAASRCSSDARFNAISSCPETEASTRTVRTSGSPAAWMDSAKAWLAESGTATMVRKFAALHVAAMESASESGLP